MRERQRVEITADGVTTDTVMLEDAGFAQRIRELKDSVPECCPGAVRLLTVACNGCGTRRGLDLDHPQLPAGWVTCEKGEFCPGCR